jgi:hypothetical protein
MKLEWQVLSLKLHALLLDTLQQTFQSKKAGRMENWVHKKQLPYFNQHHSKAYSIFFRQFLNLLYEENRKTKFQLASCLSKLCTRVHCFCHCQHGVLDRYVLFACFELGMGSLPKLLDSWRFQLLLGVIYLQNKDMISK